jgi:hypothetical protein
MPLFKFPPPAHLVARARTQGHCCGTENVSRSTRGYGRVQVLPRLAQIVRLYLARRVPGQGQQGDRFCLQPEPCRVHDRTAFPTRLYPKVKKMKREFLDEAKSGCQRHSQCERRIWYQRRFRWPHRRARLSGLIGSRSNQAVGRVIRIPVCTVSTWGPAR